MSIRRLTILSSVALATLALATGAAAQDADGRRKLVREALERDAPPVRVNSATGIQPTPWSGLPLGEAGPSGPSNPLPGIAWTPGGPGSGGGSGEPLAYGGTYEALSVLSCPEGSSGCQFTRMSDSGTWLAGHVQLERVDLLERGCSYTIQRAAAWELGEDASIRSVHELPNAVPEGGRDWAEIRDVNDEGVVVGQSFRAWMNPNCSPTWVRPVLWRRDDAGTWVQQDLPTPETLHTGFALAINNQGWVLGHYVLDLDGDGAHEAETESVVVWIPDEDAPGGYRVEYLPPPGPGSFRRNTSWGGQWIGDVGRVHFGYQLEGDEVARPVVWGRGRFGNWFPHLLPLGEGEMLYGLGMDAEGDLLGYRWTSAGGEIRMLAVRWTLDPASGVWLGPEDLGIDTAGDSRAMFQDGDDFVVGFSTLNSGPGGGTHVVVREGDTWSRLDELLGGQWEVQTVYDVGGYRWLLVSGFQTRNGPRETFIIAPQRL